MKSLAQYLLNMGVHLKLKKEEVVLHLFGQKIAETHSNNTNTVINFESIAARLLS